MASGSFKDTFKILDSVFANTTFSNEEKLLPRDAEEAIDAYLDKHTNIDDNDVQRLNDELLRIHAQYVVVDRSENRLGPFLRVLVKLQPALKSENVLQNWWHLVVEPIFDDGKVHWRSAVDNACQFVLALLSYDAEVIENSEAAKRASHFLRQFLETYLKHTRLLTAGIDEHGLSKEDRGARRRIESVLILYQEQKPRELFLAIVPLILAAESRIQALSLLSTLLKEQPKNLDAVPKTPLLEQLLRCLMIDTSATVISLALSCLIMLLPHIPGLIVTQLPRLFLIYSRLLCWERFRPTEEDDSKQLSELDESKDEDDDWGNKDAEPHEDESWEKLSPLPGQSDTVGPPEVLHYFTFLYGLYPLNFTSYIRKPRKYLKSVNFPGARNFDLDQTIIKARTEKYQSLHLLHPNFYTTTIEDELNGSRWVKSDTADVVAECMKLCVIDPLLLENHFPESVSKSPDRRQLSGKHDELDDEIPPEYSLLGRPQSLRDSNTREGSSASVTQSEQYDLSHKSPSTAALSSPRGMEQSPTLLPTIQSQSFFKGFQISPRRESIVSFNSASASASEKNRTEEHEPVHPQYNPLNFAHALDIESKPESAVELLQEENILLRNQINVESHFRKHFAVHFRVLNSRRLKETRVEQETQNLINNNKSLKAKLARSYEAYVTLKNETATGRTQSKKWEKELTMRLRKLKEEEKDWSRQRDSMEHDIKNLKSRSEALLTDLAAKRLKVRHLEEDNLSMTLKVAKTEGLQTKVAEYEEMLKNFDMRGLELKKTKEEEAMLRRQLQITTERMERFSKDACAAKVEAAREIRQLREQNIAMQYDATLSATPGELSPQVKSLIDSAVTIKNDTIAFLEKEKLVLSKLVEKLKNDRQALQRCVLDLETRLSEIIQSESTKNSRNSLTPRSFAWHMNQTQSEIPASASDDEGDLGVEGHTNDGASLNPLRPSYPRRLGAFHPATLEATALRTNPTNLAVSDDNYSAGDGLPLGTPLSGTTVSAPVTPSLAATTGGVRLEPALSQHSPRFVQRPSSTRRPSSLRVAGDGNEEGRAGALGAALYANQRNKHSIDSLDSINLGSTGSKNGGDASGRTKKEVRSLLRLKNKDTSGNVNSKNSISDDGVNNKTTPKKPTPKTGGFRGMRGIM